MPFGDKKSLFYKNLVKGGCKTKKSRFLNRFKSCFDTASLKISTRAFRIRIQISKRSIGRRAVVILLQEKNFGPNVIYYVSAFIDNNTKHKNIKGYLNGGTKGNLREFLKATLAGGITWSAYYSGAFIYSVRTL